MNPRARAGVPHEDVLLRSTELDSDDEGTAILPGDSQLRNRSLDDIENDSEMNSGGLNSGTRSITRSPSCPIDLLALTGSARTACSPRSVWRPWRSEWRPRLSAADGCGCSRPSWKRPGAGERATKPAGLDGTRVEATIHS